ncbi:MAG TPA: CUAEP/CCAEP-tail radical SAM protein [Gemmatimonadales bacterium]|nr:CUAEP/CCAEP-tail radical SAM protein [Gemmatimonadales bacterium]
MSRDPGGVLLVSCYELGHQPLATALAAAFLRRAGFQPHQVDLAQSPLDPEAVRRAGVIAFSVPMHTALRIGVGAARQARALNPGAAIGFFGLYAWLNREYLLDGLADWVVAGESEDALVDRVNGVPGPRGGAAPVLRRLDYPVPERTGLPGLDRYVMLEHRGNRVPAGYVEGSRGCLHRCRHCPIPPVYDGRFFAVPVETVMADVRAQIAAGARHITFGDPDFLNGPGHARRLTAALHGEFPDVTFDFTAKVEHLLRHRALLPELARANAIFAVSAVESLSDTVLAHLEKGHTRADILEVLDVTRAAGIALRPTFVAFTPWTTLDDYVELVEFVAEAGLTRHVDPIQLAIRLLVPPGSGLLDRPAIHPHLGPLDRARLGYSWTHPDPRMDRLCATVTGIVDRGTRDGHAPERIVEMVRAAARSAREGRPVPARPVTGRADEVPRLTESWFCCAEPAPEQLVTLAPRT